MSAIMFRLITSVFVSCLLLSPAYGQDTLNIDIERNLYPNQLQSMTLEGREFFYIENQNQTPITKGLAILIADTGLAMVSQRGLAPLAAKLNELGWATILVNAPSRAFSYNDDSKDMAPDAQPQQEPIPETPPETDETQAPQSAPMPHSMQSHSVISTAAFDAHQQDLISLLNVGVTKAGTYPGYYLVVAQGMSAAWLTKIYAEAKSNIPDAFVAIDPYWPDMMLNKDIPKLLALTPMPVLDINTEWSNNLASHTASERQMEAKKSLKMLYRQRLLTGPNALHKQSHRISREIHGWLTHMGW